MIASASLRDRIDGIKSRVKLAEVMESYGVELKQSGFSLMACCSFHEDRSPSLSISNELYHCFGCGAGGDVICFVREMQSGTDISAVESLEHGSFGIVNPKHYESRKKPDCAKPPIGDQEYDAIVSKGLDEFPGAITSISERFGWKATTSQTLNREGVLGATRDRQALWIWPGTFQRENWPGCTPKRLSARGRKFTGLYRVQALRDHHAAVLIGEGAKDVAACVDSGLDDHPAVHVLGLVSKSVRKDSLEFFRPLAGKRAVLLLDRDADPTTVHKLAMRLKGVGCHGVRFLDWAKVPCDGLSKGADIDDLRASVGRDVLKGHLPSWLTLI